MCYSSYHNKALAAGQTWATVEEFRRLPLACLGGPAMVVSLFWLGWASLSVVNPIVPMVAGFFFAIGFLFFIAMLNYLTDAYQQNSASAQAAASTIRSITACSLPLATKSMYGNLGIHWANFAVGICCLGDGGDSVHFRQIWRIVKAEDAISNNLMMKCLDPRVTLLSKNLFRANSYAMHSTTPVERNPSSTLRDRVHILGLGSIGTFVAHSVSEIPNGPSVILLLHRRSLLDHYRQNRNQIFFESRHGVHQSSTGYGLEMTQDNQWYPVSDESPSDCPITSHISNLIICVKATQTVSALRPLVHRLNSTSNILFLQNGSGMIEEVDAHLFQDPLTRPNYLIGVISHGVTLNSPFNITHTGFSATSIGPVPRDDGRYAAISDLRSNYLLQTLPLSPTLNLKSYPYTEILQVQLEKLAVNAFCNPLCALNDAKNEFLFQLLALPELKGVQGLEERFSVARLEKTVNDIIAKTANTTCSMVWDLRAGRETAIQFINGSWSRMGKMVGVDTPVNDALVEQIQMRGRENLEMSDQ
ncbi:hypothetical protein KXV70_007454 [Aspergillus fumigatus]|nr:hypothetical protein CNMCM8714_006033 [Aspergillus fumigatus]KAF4273784.1 hypothetical protein CNMCM8812_007005 [Aspergillus fumigatus]KAH1421006.1 hypothetical protein KXX64_000271 [Aspergillus fumigatus]KAH1571964.1 hypothetical protein KXX17_009740 [Aspergillus fumigatus]KAH1910235.1 hypothetical protein KXW69_009268 [Aspergillus fumigatus]